MRIGEVAGLVGIAASKVRFLEARGLVSSTRLSSGYRDYDESVLVTLRTILQAQSLGFTLDEISKAYIATAECETCSDYLGELLAAKIAEVERHIVGARAFQLRLLDAADELETRRGTEQSAQIGRA